MRKLFEDNAIDIDAIIEQGWLEEARSLGRLRLVESIVHKSEADPMGTVDLANEAQVILHGCLSICIFGGLCLV